jgi:hypothetical protein
MQSPFYTFQIPPKLGWLAVGPTTRERESCKKFMQEKAAETTQEEEEKRGGI